MLTAEWITCPALPAAGCCVFYARKRWTMAAVPEHAALHISADSRFRLSVNGIYAGVGPVRGSTTLNYHETFDIAPLLKAGENEVFVEVWSQREENFVIHSIEPALWCELVGVWATAPGAGWEVQTARGWKSDVPHYTMQNGFMEWCDLRESADPEAWLPAAAAKSPELVAKRLLPDPLPEFPETAHRPVEILSQYEVGALDIFDAHRIPDVLAEEAHLPLCAGRTANLDALFTGKGAATLLPGKNGIGMIWDFGAEISGRLEIELDAPAGTTVQIAYGEALSGDRIRTRFPMDYHFTDAWILKAGMNLVSTAFAERGFRTVMISVRDFDRPVTVKRVSGINRRYPFTPRGTFFSSDYRLNRIFEVCQETLSACASDVFMDCPWRERAFWLNDMIVNNAATLHCFGATELHRHCFELAFSQDNHPSGLLSAVIPMPQMAEQCDFIFAPTNLYMMLMLKDYWDFSGDGETVRRYLPDMERILNALWSLADDEGILQTSGVTAEWNFYDWSFEENKLCCNNAAESMLSSLYLIASKEFENAANALGYDFDQAEFQHRRALTAQHFETRFVNPETGLIEDELRSSEDVSIRINRSIQLSHALWLLTGEASPKVAETCRKALTDKELLMPDYYLHYFWFRAANLAGKHLEALQRIRYYWGRCIDTGSPTLYEAGIHTFGKQAMSGSGSLCHGFGTIPTAFLHETVLGVKALKPGFAEFSFAPQLLDLEFAGGRIPVPGGTIHVRLTKETTEITIPAGCTAILPDGSRLASGLHLVNVRC